MSNKKFSPSISDLCAALEIPQSDLLKDKECTVTTSALRAVIGLYVEQLKFDENYYLQNNKDIETAIDKGLIGSAHEHFVKTGYFEERECTELYFDEDWYLETYSDVASSVTQGYIPNAFSHYQNTGKYEGRSPNKSTFEGRSYWSSINK